MYQLFSGRTPQGNSCIPSTTRLSPSGAWHRRRKQELNKTRKKAANWANTTGLRSDAEPARGGQRPWDGPAEKLFSEGRFYFIVPSHADCCLRRIAKKRQRTATIFASTTMDRPLNIRVGRCKGAQLCGHTGHRHRTSSGPEPAHQARECRMPRRIRGRRRRGIRSLTDSHEELQPNNSTGLSRRGRRDVNRPPRSLRTRGKRA